MKTIVSIELTDHQRNALANMIRGKASGKLATRAEINALVQQHIAGLLGEQNGIIEGVAPKDHYTMTELAIPDPEDAALLKGKSADYVRGWNKVKRA